MNTLRLGAQPSPVWRSIGSARSSGLFTRWPWALLTYVPAHGRRSPGSGERAAISPFTRVPSPLHEFTARHSLQFSGTRRRVACELSVAASFTGRPGRSVPTAQARTCVGYTRDLYDPLSRPRILPGWAHLRGHRVARN